MAKRRVVLLAALTATIGGCVSRDEGESPLSWVALSNYHDESHTVELEIDWEEETILSETYALPANDSVPDDTPGGIVNWPWPDGPGQFTVSARSAGGKWWRVDPADKEYPDCFAVQGLIDESTGNFALATFTEEHVCGEDEIERLRNRAENHSLSAYAVDD